jgi:hypothetical protein
MIFYMIIPFFTSMAILFTSNKSRHACYHIEMIVMQKQINPFLLIRPGKNDRILMLFRNNVDLIIGQIRLKLFDLVYTARCGLRWSTILLYRLSFSILAIETASARAKHKSSLFQWIRMIEPFLAKCFSKFISERFVPVPPLGISTWTKFTLTIGSPMLWLPACARARHCIVVLFPKVGKCNQTNNTYTFKQSKILQISLQLR